MASGFGFRIRGSGCQVSVSGSGVSAFRVSGPGLCSPLSKPRVGIEGWGDSDLGCTWVPRS